MTLIPILLYLPQEDYGVYGDHSPTIPDVFKVNITWFGDLHDWYSIEPKGQDPVKDLVVDLVVGFVPGLETVISLIQGDVAGAVKDLGVEIVTWGIGKRAALLVKTAKALPNVMSVRRTIRAWRFVRASASARQGRIFLSVEVVEKIISQTSIAIKKNPKVRELVKRAEKLKKLEGAIEQGDDWLSRGEIVMDWLKWNPHISEISINVFARMSGFETPNGSLMYWEDYWVFLKRNMYIITEEDGKLAMNIHPDKAAKLYGSDAATAKLSVKEFIELKLNQIYYNVKRIIEEPASEYVDEKVLAAAVDYLNGDYEYIIREILVRPQPVNQEDCRGVVSRFGEAAMCL